MAGKPTTAQVALGSGNANVMRRIEKIGRLLYLPYKWLVYIPILLVSTTIFGSLAFLMTFVFPPRIATFCGTLWARVNAYFTPMWVRVSGRENIDPRQSYVVACNHQSQFDIFVLYGWLGIDFKWVMKADLRKVPFLGPACERLEHIFIDRSNTQAAVASINQAKSRIVNGTSVVFFPEGTRSDTGELKTFKKGAFKFALDLGLPILPITITGTRKILPTKTMDLFPGVARMKIHPPISTDGYKKEDMPRLIEDVRGVIASGL